MPNLTLTFTNQLPTNLSTTDTAWYLDISAGVEIQLGEVTNISGTTIIISLIPGATIPDAEDFIFYVKNPIAHIGQLKGYYAEAQFRNNSTSYAELFSVGTEIFESSK